MRPRCARKAEGVIKEQRRNGEEMSGILDRINEPNDIKTIAPEEYRQLAKEIRRFLIQQISRTGGHVASNLGVVELTMALHLTMNFPEDKDKESA